jgi:hypothetical protein
MEKMEWKKEDRKITTLQATGTTTAKISICRAQMQAQIKKI